MIQSGRDLRRCPVQSPAQSRVNYEIRPGGTGLYLLRSLKPPKWGLHNLSRQPVLLPGCPCGEKVFLIFQTESLLLQLVLVAS